MAPHILVIDDRGSLPHFIAMELRAEGYQVSLNRGNALESSISGEEAPTLIVLNWELRGASGMAIYRHIRLIDPQVPIVVITARDEISCHMALELGAQACLTKPFSMEDLLQAIEYHLNGKVILGACTP